jgi:hypothetical protein
MLEALSLTLLWLPYSDDGNDHWVIQAPKLRFFSIADLFYYGWRISDLPSLEQVRIECPFDQDFVKHMAGLARARSLHVQIQVKCFLQFDETSFLLLRGFI